MDIPNGGMLEGLQSSLETLSSAIKKSQTVHQNTQATKEAARALVQRWFRDIRAKLRDRGVSDLILNEIDSGMQDLLRFAQVRTRTESYVSLLRTLKTQIDDLEVEIELTVSENIPRGRSAGLSDFELRLLETLENLVPSGALSYRQAIQDLDDSSRISYRGTANELRAVLWDVLERLAPDDSVISAPGFKFEDGRISPTQKQKARFILRSRLGGSARKTPEITIDLIEDRIGALSRAVYDRSSISAHVAASRAEVVQVKMYLDTVLSELLEVSQR